MSFKTDLIIFNKKINSHEERIFQFGFIFFNLGLFLLLSAPFLSVLSILIAMISSYFQHKKNFWATRLNKSFILLSIVLIINTLISFFSDVNQFEEWQFTENIIGLFNWIPFFICFFLIQPFLKNTKHRTFSTYTLLIGTFPLFITGIGEYFLGWDNQLSTLNGYIIWFLKPKYELKGLSGLFSNSNYAASWLSMIWPLALAIILTNIKSKVKMTFSLLYGLIIILSILLTNSKDTLISLFIPIIFLINQSFIKFIILASAITIIIFLYEQYFIKLGLNKLLLSIWDKSIDIDFKNFLEIFPRIDIWRVSLIAIFNKPLLGWGAASFPFIYSLYKNELIKDSIFHSHNLFLESSINFGLPFSILLFLIIFQLLLKSWKIIFLKNKNIINRCWWISTFLFIFNHMFDVTYYDVRISLLFWIMLAGLNCIVNEEQITNNIKLKGFQFI